MRSVINNADESRYELTEQGKLAFADYVLENDVITIPHVEADPALRGTGAAGRLMEGMLADVRKKGLKVRPICGYAVAYMRKHHEVSDLLA
ncbi:GNAT family N-acetyltransferase [Luteolibacter algae]|uniref:GNAT family N-acetyltransferase n=1 Tax=Luteolibacter algae TaxID=454151 RepID=A0ABW5D803_9BACT